MAAVHAATGPVFGIQTEQAMSNAVAENGTSEVRNKPDIARSANCQEKLQMIMVSMALRARSRCWKVLDDKEDSLSALPSISLDDDAKLVCHLRGTCNEARRQPPALRLPGKLPRRVAAKPASLRQLVALPALAD